MSDSERPDHPPPGRRFARPPKNPIDRAIPIVYCDISSEFDRGDILMNDDYYWPTPDDWKVTIKRGECGLDYKTIPKELPSFSGD